jgi:nucleotide-binding universal stress UspA family protein
VYVQRVVVGVSGSPGSLEALRHAAELARNYAASLAPVLAWLPPGGDLADRRYPCAELRAEWKQAAHDRLCKAIELAIGGSPDGIAFEPRIARGEAGDVLTRFAREPGNLLVIGSGRQGRLRRLRHGHVPRYCLAHCACPVIAVPPSRLAAEAHRLRGWMDRHRLQAEDADLRAAA